ncbi:unnamed protein product [Menidia menidia]|uniref:(Atlantic silverside) hypothetical protein n=1 Tax=Menidia menidia TaxID=238744 RepID=A0A8S4AJH3_9TELE|nr:unnamed protein product [Menidia menidia]
MLPWKSWFYLFYIPPLLCKVMSVEFQLAPLNSTVLQGSDAQFNATVQGPWQVMTWTVGTTLVLIFSETTENKSSDQFSANFCVSGNTSCVTFTIHDVNTANTGPVSCALIGATPKTAQLYVQETGLVSITGGNVTVRHRFGVKFECVSTNWFIEPSVSWRQNGEAVDSSLYNTSSSPYQSSTNATYFNSTSILTFQAAGDTTVECLATVPGLKTPKSSSVFLDVVFPDWTVLIAVVVSFGGFALVVLLILGIMFCYKRRKEKKRSYDDDVRRVRTQSQLGRITAPGDKHGQENPSFVSDGQTGSNDVTESNVYHVNLPDILELPDFSDGNAGFMKHRHATTV